MGHEKFISICNLSVHRVSVYRGLTVYGEKEEGIDVSCAKFFWETEDLSLLLVRSLSKLSKETLLIFHL